MHRQIVINQHYVPRFYLDNFAVNRQNWVYDKRHDSVKLKSNKSLCSTEHFYDLPATLDAANEALFQVVEKQLGVVETIGQRMIFALIKASDRVVPELVNPGAYNRIKPRQLQNLCDYIALQYLRTEAMRDLVRRENYAVASDFIRAKANSVSPGIEVSKIAFEVSENWIKWYHIFSMFSFPEYTHHFAEKIVVLGINRTAIKLVTSDTPVVMVPDDPKQIRLDAPGIRLIFPLSPEVAICMYEPKVWKDMAPWDCQPKMLSAEEVELFNFGQLASSRRQIFGRQEKDLRFVVEIAEQDPSIVQVDTSTDPVSTPEERATVVDSMCRE